MGSVVDFFWWCWYGVDFFYFGVGGVGYVFVVVWFGFVDVDVYLVDD